MSAERKSLVLGGCRPLDGAGATEHYSLDPDDLSTHSAIVGMTGSGKTGLLMVVVEEALRMALRRQQREDSPDFPASTRSGGVRPGVNLGDSDDLYQLIYGEDDRRAALLVGANAPKNPPT